MKTNSFPWSVFSVGAATIWWTSVSLGAQVQCQETEDGITLSREAKHVLTYNKTAAVPPGVDPAYARSGFVHPITTPSGRVLTDAYPLPHHTHQHGLFFAWKKAVFEGEAANFWEHHDSGATVRHDAVLEIVNGKSRAGFRVRLVHLLGERVVLKEEWKVMIDAETGFIDFSSKQVCATDSPLVLQRFHYGAMALRGSRQWFGDATGEAKEAAEAKERCRLLTSEGRTRVDGNHTRPKWVCMTGPLGGEAVAITLIPHSTNFRYPQHVRLHPEMPYFCFIPTVDEGFQIEPGKPWVSRYRIVIDDGEPDPKRLHEIRKAYAGEG